MRKWILPGVLLACGLLFLAMAFWTTIFHEDAGVVPEPVPRTITIDGVVITYVDTIEASSAPDSGAGVWWGSDSTTDGDYCFFIGHDYNAFGAVAELEVGDPVTVMDSSGDSRTYYVFDSFTVPDDSHFAEFADRIEGHGESIVMQTCVTGGNQIVVAS